MRAEVAGGGLPEAAGPLVGEEKRVGGASLE